MRVQYPTNTHNFFGPSDGAGPSDKRARTVDPEPVTRARPTDPVYAHYNSFVALPDYWWNVTCNYCHVPYRVKAFRAVAHLGHISGKGIVPCTRVPPDVFI